MGTLLPRKDPQKRIAFRRTFGLSGDLGSTLDEKKPGARPGRVKEDVDAISR
jgi:hypothetical protein